MLEELTRLFQGEEALITIRSLTAQKWRGKLGYEYKDVRKNVFTDGHKRSDVIKDRPDFFKKNGRAPTIYG